MRYYKEQGPAKPHAMADRTPRWSRARTVATLRRLLDCATPYYHYTTTIATATTAAIATTIIATTTEYHHRSYHGSTCTTHIH